MSKMEDRVILNREECVVLPFPKKDSSCARQDQSLKVALDRLSKRARKLKW